MPSIWDHRADKDLLMIIILDGQLGHMNWSVISEKMATKGYTFTMEACRQHYHKIRKEFSVGLGGASPKTPRRVTKAKAVTPSSRESKKMSGAGAGIVGGDGDGDGEDKLVIDVADDSPSRRPRVPKREAGMDNGGGFAGQTAVQFKIEGENRVDLDDEDSLYI